MPYPEIIIYPAMNATPVSNFEFNLNPENLQMEMDLCTQLEAMGLGKRWGKEKEGKRSLRSTQYASDRRRPRSNHVRLGRLDLPYRRIGFLKQQRRRAIGLRSSPADTVIHRSLSNDRRRVSGSDLHAPIIVRSFSTGSPIMCHMFQ